MQIRKVFTTAIILILFFTTNIGAVNAQLLEGGGIPFGFEIERTRSCSCFTFNRQYHPANLGLPAPLPIAPDGTWPGYLVSLPPLLRPLFNALPFITTPREFGYTPIRSGDWVKGVTHVIPLPMACVRVTVVPPCTTDTGWLWRYIGSNRQ